MNLEDKSSTFLQGAKIHKKNYLSSRSFSQQAAKSIFEKELDKELNIISQILELKDSGVSDAEILAKMEKECPESRNCLELIQKLKKERETCCPNKDLLKKIINSLPDDKINKIKFGQAFTKLLSRVHLKIALPVGMIAIALITIIFNYPRLNIFIQNPATEIQGLTTTLINEVTTEKSTIEAAKNDVQLINASYSNLEDLGQFPYDIEF